MAKETSKIFEAAKEAIEGWYNNGIDIELLAQYIAEDISLAVVNVYGKGSTAKGVLDGISYRVQGGCNPALKDANEDDF